MRLTTVNFTKYILEERGLQGKLPNNVTVVQQILNQKLLIRIAASSIFSIQLDLMFFLGLRNWTPSLVFIVTTALRLGKQYSSMFQFWSSPFNLNRSIISYTYNLNIFLKWVCWCKQEECAPFWKTAAHSNPMNTVFPTQVKLDGK